MAAITYTETGTLNRTSYSDLLDKTFDEVKATNDRVPIQGAQFFAERNASTMEYKHTQVGTILDLPVKSEDEGPIPWVQPSPHYDTTFTLVNYRSGIKITRTLVETDQYGKIGDMMAGLFKSFQRKKEYQFANVFNNAFSTTGADGAALFAVSHSHPDGTAGTWDNLNTAADITPDSYSAMRLNMRARTDEKGFPNPLKLNQLVVVADKERRAKEVMGSSQTADTSLNNMFAFHGESNIVVWDWLTSTTAWFGCDTSASENEKGLFEINRVAPEISSADKEVGTDIVMAKRLRFSNAVGATIMYAWDGCEGA